MQDIHPVSRGVFSELGPRAVHQVAGIQPAPAHYRDLPGNTSHSSFAKFCLWWFMWRWWIYPQSMTCWIGRMVTVIMASEAFPVLRQTQKNRFCFGCFLGICVAASCWCPTLQCLRLKQSLYIELRVKPLYSRLFDLKTRRSERFSGDPGDP